MNQYIIYSPAKGYWSPTLGWSASIDQAEPFSEAQKTFYEERPYHLPFTGTNDVQIVSITTPQRLSGTLFKWCLSIAHFGKLGRNIKRTKKKDPQPV